MACKGEDLIHRREQIGAGGFGTVSIGRYREHQEVAIKDIKGELSREAIAEANLLKKLTHPNIIRYIDIVQASKQTSIIMEFIDGGSLYQYIRNTTQSLTYWKMTRQIMIGVAYGMTYLHDQRVVHADLKSLNVLLRHDYTAVICDFGLARTIADSTVVTTGPTRGTAMWFAPELCRNRPEKSSFQSDVWAFGCVLLEVLSKKLPWQDDYDSSMILINALGKPENAPIFEDICRQQKAPEKLRTLLCRCCSWQKNDRPEFHAIVQDLTTITDVDLCNGNQEQEKSLQSEPPSVRSSTSNGQSRTKCSSSKVNNQNSEENVKSVEQSKVGKSRGRPKKTPVIQTDTDTIIQEQTFSLRSNLANAKPRPHKASILLSPHGTNEPLDSIAAALDLLKVDNPKNKKSTADSLADKANVRKQNTMYAFVNNQHRLLYQGERGAWYYINSNGNKVYT
ncbi:unnamed protein product [Rotaria magnacalcarata]|uniref:Protein kinase domain-containing protein n=1 Tax=Rotaria magnacalcarata TaxID=392030 RepID=A0A816TJX2_9BILA|nr:unnamed protein product [Rotaria magnacalcarata]CAF4173863.1 unnamed protein product [Rotaria magnacalcarata]